MRRLLHAAVLTHLHGSSDRWLDAGSSACSTRVAPNSFPILQPKTKKAANPYSSRPSVICPVRTRTDSGNVKPGLELRQSGAGRAAESGAVDARGCGRERTAVREGDAEAGVDPALRLLIEVWSQLPDAAKSRILRLADDALAVPLIR